jgi:hypothetical protein
MQSNTSAVTAAPIATASDPLQIRNTETESSSLRSIEVVSPMTAAHSLHSDNNETDADLTQTQGSLSNEEHHEEHAVTECSNVDCSKSECVTKSSAVDGQLASKTYLIIANVSKKPNMKTLIYSAAAHGFSVAIVGIPNMSISDLHLAEEVVGSGDADNRSRECWRNNNNNINVQNTANNSNSNNENDNNNSSSSSSVNCNNKSVKEHKDASDTHNIVDIASSVDANRDQLGTTDGDDRTIEIDSKEREDRVCSIDNQSKDILHTALASNLYTDSDSDSKNRNNSSDNDSNNNSKYLDDERGRDRDSNSNSNNNTSSLSTDSPSGTLHTHSSSSELFSSSTASTSISTSISKNMAPKTTVSPSKPSCNIIRFETLGELKLFLTEQNIKLFGIEIMDEGKHAVIRSSLI